MNVDGKQPVCVIGLGLIGGSVLRAARGAGREVWGATLSEDDAAAARDAGYNVLDLSEALAAASRQDALVVLAVPLPTVGAVLREVAEHAPECLVTDVVSVKEPVSDEVRRVLGPGRYAGGHPMSGTASAGWASGNADLFRDAAWVVGVEEDTGLEAWGAATRLALDCGARTVPASPAEHDAAVARVSHLPHVFAAVLAAAARDGGPLARNLAAGSLRDATRVAGSCPDLVRAMCEGNRAALLDAVDDSLGRLGAARGSLASTGSLKSTVDAGYDARTELIGTDETHREWLLLDSPAALERLRLLGGAGGSVVDLSAPAATGTSGWALCELPEGLELADLEPEDPETPDPE